MLKLNYKLILGSKSPRRSDLLTTAGVEYEIRVIETEESYPDDLEIERIAEFIAEKKVAAHSDSIAQGEVVLTADTIVVFEGKVYGKPKSTEEAVDTILMLSGNTHLVYTGVCMKSKTKQESFTVFSKVKFAEITPEESQFYVDNFKPLDKAGSYGLQDWIGFTRVEWIEGSYTNILGLPLSQTYDALKKF